MTHSADYSRFAISSLDRSVHVYSADPFTTAHFTLTHTFSSPAGTITGVVSDLQNALYSVSSDHHFLITSLEDGRVLEDRDCGFALSSIAWDYPLVCVAGVNYSILLFSQLYPSMVCFMFSCSIDMSSGGSCREGDLFGYQSFPPFGDLRRYGCKVDGLF